MQHPASLPPSPSLRIWYPLVFADRSGRLYRVSFLVAEEATWDHRLHDLDGRELAAGALDLTVGDRRGIQSSCDSAVGSLRWRPLASPANGNAEAMPAAVAIAASTA